MGFIYQIKIGEDFYIGSTKLKLSQRQQLHNQCLNNPKNIGYNYYLYKFCREHNVKKIICELLETVEDGELKILEQEYIKMLEPTLNTNRAYRTIEEYKEQMRLINKKHSEKNNKIKSNCPICGLEMLKKNIKQHIKNIHNI